MYSFAKNSLTPAWMALSMSRVWDENVVAPAGRQHNRASWLVRDERREVEEEKSVGRVRMVEVVLKEGEEEEEEAVGGGV